MIISLILISLTGVMLVVAFIFVVMNRASPVVVNAALPTAMALLTALAFVFAANLPPPINRVFPVILVVEKSSLLPIMIPDRPFPVQGLILADQMGHLDPEIFNLSKEQVIFSSVGLLYHEYLQKLFIDDLAQKQHGSWRMRIERFVDQIQWSPMPDASSYPSTILNVQQLEQIFAKNRFARVYSGFGKWALPPGTELLIELPRKDDQLGEIGTIHLKNGLCEITIQTAQSMTHVGLGKYTPLVGIDIGEAQQKYWTFQYMTRIDVSFPWYRIGDPNMAAYREWANAIIEELSFSFDEESLWNRTKDNFILKQHFERSRPEIPIHLGPIRMGNPPSSKETRPKTEGN